MAKGGVGKTTTAVNLSYGLAQRGHKVLLIDCDTQNQAAKFLDVKPPYGLYEFVIEKNIHGELVSKKDAIYPARKNLWLLAGGISLGHLKNWLYEFSENERHNILSKKLAPKEGTLDYIIFDCAPGWDILSVNILTTADEILCPVSLQGPAVDGLKTYIKYIASAQKINNSLELKYILPTLHDRRTKQSFEILEQLQKAFGDKICDPIHSNVRVSEAPTHGLTIFEYSPKAIGSLDYQKLVEKVLRNGKK